MLRIQGGISAEGSRQTRAFHGRYRSVINNPGLVSVELQQYHFGTDFCQGKGDVFEAIFFYNVQMEGSKEGREMAQFYIPE
jgi:hypothetical protein